MFHSYSVYPTFVKETNHVFAAKLYKDISIQVIIDVLIDLEVAAKLNYAVNVSGLKSALY